MFRVVVFAALSDPVLDRAFDAAGFLRSRVSFPVSRRRFRTVGVSFYYFYLHKGDDALRVRRAGKFLVFDFSFVSVSSSINSPGPHRRATQSFSSVAKLTPNDRSLVRRQRVV